MLFVDTLTLWLVMDYWKDTKFPANNFVNFKSITLLWDALKRFNISYCDFMIFVHVDLANVYYVTMQFFELTCCYS